MFSVPYAQCTVRIKASGRGISHSCLSELDLGMNFSPLTHQQLLHSKPVGVSNQTRNTLIRRPSLCPGVGEKLKDRIANLKF